MYCAFTHISIHLPITFHCAYLCLHTGRQTGRQSLTCIWHTDSTPTTHRTCRITRNTSPTRHTSCSTPCQNLYEKKNQQQIIKKEQNEPK